MGREKKWTVSVVDKMLLLHRASPGQSHGLWPVRGEGNGNMPATGHPFEALFDDYWSSTTSMFEPDWAWVLYLNKGATGVGYKPEQHFHVWPVREE